MTKKMTVVFPRVKIYRRLEVEANKLHKSANEIVVEVVNEWLECREDAELIPIIEAAKKELAEKGSRPWDEVRKEMDEAIERREAAAKNSVEVQNRG